MMLSRCLLAGLLPWAVVLGAEAGPARHPAYEPDLGGALAGESGMANLFAGATVSASGQWGEQGAEQAVDGNKELASHWAAENLPVWHQVELAEATELGAVRVWPYWGDGRIYQFKVEGSIDGQNWQMLGDFSGNSITSSAEGTLVSFEPRPLRLVRTTFTGNSRGARSGGHLVEIEGYAREPETGLGGGVGTLDLRYPPVGEVADLQPFAEGVALTAWRGERVNAQVVVQAGAGAQANLRVEPGVVRWSEAGRAAAGNRREIPVQSHFIRYTLADGKPQGDILDTAQRLDLAAGHNRPVWLQLDVPADAVPGFYKGTVTVRSDAGAVEIPLQLEVLAATLPAPADWEFHLDLWQHPQAVARWHGVTPWSEEHLALLEPSMKRLAAAGQKTITCSIIHEPWNQQTYDWFPSMVQWTRRADGSWGYDYSVLDRWVQFMSERCGLNEARIHCYSLLPWSLKFRYFDEAQHKEVDSSLQPGTAEFDEFWGRFLEDFVAHLKERGWLERTRIAVDERPDAQMRGALETLQRHAPELLVASAINQPSDLTRGVDDISPAINHTDRFPRSLVEERREAGHITSYYVCTNPQVPNTFTFSPPAESEWLPLFAAANGLDGLLRWAWHSWVENPFQSTDFVTWQSGDCFLVYPGDRSSVRFERLRDGIESYEKLRLLREQAAVAPTPELTEALAAVDAVLVDFSWPRGATSGVHTDDVKRFNAALLEATRAVLP